MKVGSSQIPSKTASTESGLNSDALLQVSEVGFDYANLPILDNVSISVGRGEFIAIVGPSGCGKSTLLNVISGVLQPRSGTITSDGLVTRIERLGSISYLQQRDLLLPWRTVAENSRLGLELRGHKTLDSNKSVLALAKQFGIADVLDHMPWQLSGGMRQRVALLRAVLPENPVLLLDEPFGALDAISRRQLQRWLVEVLDTSEKAVILVTHDVEEAILLADRVVVMAANPGHIIYEVPVVLDARSYKFDLVTDPEFLRLKSSIIKMLDTQESVR